MHGSIGVLETLYGGIDMNHINDGGLECAKQGGSMLFRVIETSLVMIVAIYETWSGFNEFKQIKFNESNLNTKRILSSQRRTYLLVILTLVFGMEIAFKLQTRQVSEYQWFMFYSPNYLKLIFLLNPCHIFTMLQIYFLASRPTKRMHLLFHAHQPILFGTLLAMIFPETATRHHPLQKETYWVQHLLIYTIPAQLMVTSPHSTLANV